MNSIQNPFFLLVRFLWCNLKCHIKDVVDITRCADILLWLFTTLYFFFFQCWYWHSKVWSGYCAQNLSPVKAGLHFSLTKMCHCVPTYPVFTKRLVTAMRLELLQKLELHHSYWSLGENCRALYCVGIRVCLAVRGLEAFSQSFIQNFCLSPLGRFMFWESKVDIIWGIWWTEISMKLKCTFKLF